jgi:Family of unknown function (DUF6188)
VGDAVVSVWQWFTHNGNVREAPRTARFDHSRGRLCYTRVCEAIARQTGELRITFADGLVLEVASITGCEAWHFAKPRPGKLVGDPGPHVGVTGAAGGLI